MRKIMTLLAVSLFTISAPALALVMRSPFSRGATTSISLGTLTITNVYPRIFTPNGDGANDKVRFEMTNPEQLPVAGRIFDVTGAHVADLPQSVDVVLWDGKDSDGRTVPAGIYLYQIEFEGKHATGTVVVAR